MLAGRRDAELDPVAEGDRADVVVAARGGQADRGGDLEGHIAHAAAAAAEVGRGADIDHEQDGLLALLDVAAHERRAQARGGLPVDAAHVVAGCVWADLGEFEAAAAEGAAVFAGELVAQDAAGAEFDLTHAAAQLFAFERTGRRRQRRKERLPQRPQQPRHRTGLA